jgi:hypothetical protein
MSLRRATLLIALVPLALTTGTAVAALRQPSSRAPTTASADHRGVARAAIRECGNYAYVDGHHGYWTFGTTYGFTPVTNLTTRVMRCRRARQFALRESRAYPFHRRRNGFRCRRTELPPESYDIRCTKGRRVIHWQGGA